MCIQPFLVSFPNTLLTKALVVIPTIPGMSSVSRVGSLSPCRHLKPQVQCYFFPQLLPDRADNTSEHTFMIFLHTIPFFLKCCNTISKLSHPISLSIEKKRKIFHITGYILRLLHYIAKYLSVYLFYYGWYFHFGWRKTHENTEINMMKAVTKKYYFLFLSSLMSLTVYPLPFTIMWLVSVESG